MLSYLTFSEEMETCRWGWLLSARRRRVAATLSPWPPTVHTPWKGQSGIEFFPAKKASLINPSRLSTSPPAYQVIQNRLNQKTDKTVLNGSVLGAPALLAGCSETGATFGQRTNTSTVPLFSEDMPA